MLDLATVQAECRVFAHEYPTPNVREAIRLAECGRVEWHTVHVLFTQALGRALAEIGA